jgi:hypothetical protein
MRRVLVLVIGLVAAGLDVAPNALARPALSSAAVEGTYEFREVADVSGTRFPQRYEWSQWFSADTIKQGEPLQFRALQKHTAWGWCFSSDQYDITQTGLNLRTAYAPRGRAHLVTGQQLRLSATSYRNRAWRELNNCGPGCPDGIGTCPYAGTQYHELTGTVPGSDTAALQAGCYVLETYWEYGPSPPPGGIEQSESGSLPRFCVQAAATAPAPATPTPGTPSTPGVPQTPSPPGSVGAPGAVDTVAPRARALASAGAAGAIVRLRFVVSDNSGRTRQQVVVQAGNRVLARINRSLRPSSASQIAFVNYRLPAKAPPALRFCVVAWDRAGNASRKSCARLTVI